MRRLLYRGCVVALVVASAIVGVRAESRPIDTEHSSLTVLVFKSGLFSAFADNHEIRAPIARGTISEGQPRGIEILVRSADLRVLDPNLSPDRRAEVQTRMLGPEVLDTATFSDIIFASTSVDPAGPGRWNVAGRLTIHGQTRTLTFPVVLEQDKYRGQVTIKQSDFGIEPIRIAGGTVKVKDELTVKFEIAK
jgi:hypothetical protein